MERTMTLLNARGEPITYAKPNKPVPTVIPQTAEMGQWAGRGDLVFATMPGGGVLQFDLSKLTLADFRSMRTHYQLGASLNVLGFIMHQIDWRVECESKEIADFITDDLAQNWNKLIRATSQAHWAGFSPIAVNYENSRDGYVRIRSFKDLVPEECRVEWQEVRGWSEPGKIPPKINKFNGMRQNGYLIPKENCFWYSLMAENGDYYGRKLLKNAFPSWFFSQLIHLFANRYFERFGEPLPVGRAPFDDEVHVGNGTYVPGRQAMTDVLANIRNRAVVVLPNDKIPGTDDYEYEITYLESQMRGVDFERYMSRLDEEMSLSLFTPVLLFRTADVGSYNLGEAHLRIFQQMLNALAGDLQDHIQNYLVDRMVAINFGQDAPRAKWVFRPEGRADIQKYGLLMSELVRLGAAMPDLEQLGSIVGLDWEKLDLKDVEPVVEGNTTATGTPS
jgi:hypothetical protein